MSDLREKVAKMIAEWDWKGEKWPTDFSPDERRSYRRLADRIIRIVKEDRSEHGA